MSGHWRRIHSEAAARRGFPVRMTLLLLGFSIIALTCMMMVNVANAGELCHVPPGNPANFHTISVKEAKACKHIEHGDLLGNCNEHLDTLCSDDNACTIDHDNAVCGYNGPVNCDDSDPGTEDFCLPASGCEYTVLQSCPFYTVFDVAAASAQEGVVCNDYSDGASLDWGVNYDTTEGAITLWTQAAKSPNQTQGGIQLGPVWTGDGIIATPEENAYCIQLLCDAGCAGISPACN